MPSRESFHPNLGTYFRELRESQEWNQSQAADIAARRGLKALTYNALRYLEEGKTKNPSPELLWDVAKLYQLDYTKLVVRCVEARYGVRIKPVRATETPDVHSEIPRYRQSVLALASEISELEPSDRESFEYLLRRYLRGRVIPARSLQENAQDFQHSDRRVRPSDDVAQKISRKAAS